MEDKLEQIYQREEIYWKQRGDEEWVLEGDTNSKFFHQFASGRRRKNIIRSLDSESGVITSQDIENHITSFYKRLFGSATPSGLVLADNFWEGRQRVSAEDKEWLTREFGEEEVKSAV